MKSSTPMLPRALFALACSALLLAACGATRPATEAEICGPQGCDACVGFNCPADAGVP